MGNSLRGIYRERRPHPMEDNAWITDGNISMFLSESRYKQSGYKPAWDALPWADAAASKKIEAEMLQGSEADRNRRSHAVSEHEG